MKRSVLIIAILVIGMNMALLRYETPVQKAEDAQSNSVSENMGLAAADKEYLAEIDSYKKANAQKSIATDKSILEYKTRILSQKKKTKNNHANKIIELEQKNRDIKKKIIDYEEGGRQKWEIFKLQFNLETQEFEKLLQNLNAEIHD